VPLGLKIVPASAGLAASVIADLFAYSENWNAGKKPAQDSHNMSYFAEEPETGSFFLTGEVGTTFDRKLRRPLHEG
jgi:hypothetical protein